MRQDNAERTINAGNTCKNVIKNCPRKHTQKCMLSLRVELKTSRLLNGCSNQLSYESTAVVYFKISYILVTGSTNCSWIVVVSSRNGRSI